MSAEKTPSLTELLETAIGGFLDDLRVALPGRIEAYDPVARRATVQVLVMDTHINGDGERKTVTIAQLTDVPVALLGSGTGRIKWPVKRGHQCLLVFASSSIALLKAGVPGPVDPKSDRHHHLADAIAIPVVLFGDDVEDDAMIEFTESGEIRAGGDQPLVTREEFLAHTHTTAGTGPPTPPTRGTVQGLASDFPGTPRLRG